MPEAHPRKRHRNTHVDAGRGTTWAWTYSPLGCGEDQEGHRNSIIKLTRPSCILARTRLMEPVKFPHILACLGSRGQCTVAGIRRLLRRWHITRQNATMYVPVDLGWGAIVQ